MLKPAQVYVEELKDEEAKFYILVISVCFPDAMKSVWTEDTDPVGALEKMIADGGDPIGLIGTVKNPDDRNLVSYCRPFEEHAYAGDRGSGWAYSLLREWITDRNSELMKTGCFDTLQEADGWID